MKKEQVLGLLRHSLTFIGGLLVAKGLVDDALVAELSGAILTLVGGAWSVLVKK
jgi:hypothetical protein